MIIDILFLVFLIGGFWKGYKNGLIISVFSIIALFIGIIGALKFTHLASLYIQEWFGLCSKYLPLISFISVFIIIYLLVRIFSNILENFIKFIQLNFINKIAGAILWSGLSIFIFSTLLWFFYQAELISPELQTSSKIYRFLEPVSPYIIEVLSEFIPFLKGLYHSLESYFNQLYAISSQTPT